MAGLVLVVVATEAGEWHGAPAFVLGSELDFESELGSGHGSRGH